MSAKTAIATADAHEEGARRALLERLATGLTILANSPRMDWTCCWLSYSGPRGEPWAWERCAGGMPGGFVYGPDGRHVNCGHWHHQWEVFMA